MAYIKLTRHVRDINKSIEDIRKAGIRPITTTSMADISDVVLSSRGTGSEGRILSLSEVNERLLSKGEKPLTRNQYNTYINDLLESVGSQLTYEGAVDYAYETGLKRVKSFIDRTGYTGLYDLLKDLTKEELIELVNKVGNQTNVDKQLGYNSDAGFFNHLTDELIQYYGEDDVMSALFG